MKRLIFMLACLLPMGAFVGCRNSASDAGFGDVQRDVSGRAGLVVHWNAQTRDDQSVDQAIAQLLAHDLTADGAAQIALLNNHHLQATFEDLGIAQADLVQAGLLKNPVFDIGVRFPDRGPLGTYLDIGVAEDFLDIVLLPARKKLAAIQFDETKAKISQQVLTVADDTSADFYAYQGAREMLKLHEMDAQAATASLDAAKRLREAGNMDDLTFASERENAVMAKIDLIDAQAKEAEAREKINDDLGLAPSQLEWRAAPLPGLPPDDLAQDDLQALALRRRADLVAARQQIVAQAQVLNLTSDYRFFDGATIGPEFEHETDGQWRIGPTISIPLPLFDLGQAKMSRAQTTLRQSEEQCLALMIDIQSQVRGAQMQLNDSRRKAMLYRDELLPIENDLLSQTELRYNGMLAGVFQLLSAKKQQVDAQREYIEALRDYWIARSNLERAVGGRLPTLAPATQP